MVVLGGLVVEGVEFWSGALGAPGVLDADELIPGTPGVLDVGELVSGTPGVLEGEEIGIGAPAPGTVMLEIVGVSPVLVAIIDCSSV